MPRILAAMGDSGRRRMTVLLCAALLLCADAHGPKTPPPALHTAAGTGAIDEVKALLASGEADVNEVDSRGEPALMHAAWGGHFEVVQLLLGAGASPNPQDRNKDYPLLFAAFQGHLPIIQALCAAPGIDPNLQNKNGFTALMIAIVRRSSPLRRAPARSIAREAAAVVIAAPCRSPAWVLGVSGQCEPSTPARTTGLPQDRGQFARVWLLYRLEECRG